MAEEDWRLLACALRLGRFTPGEIARESDTNINTVHSWLRRNRAYVDPSAQPGPSAGGRGRPRKAWEVREAARETMQRRLDNVFPRNGRPASFDLRTAGYLVNLDRIERHVSACSRQEGRDERLAEQERQAGRSWTRISWQDFAELEAAGHSVAPEHLQRLAELERDLGLAEPPQATKLPDIAVWVMMRLARMQQQGAGAGFAARALWARAAVRLEEWQVQLGAAVLGASVWADEWLADAAGCDVESVRDWAGLMAAVIPAARRRDHLAGAVGAPGGFTDQDLKDRQAVAMGAARLQVDESDATRKASTYDQGVSDWLAGLRCQRCWNSALAPAVLVALSVDSSVDMDWVRATMREPIAASAKLLQEWRQQSRPAWEAGKVRRDIMAASSVALGAPAQGPGFEEVQKDAPIGAPYFDPIARPVRSVPIGGDDTGRHVEGQRHAMTAQPERFSVGRQASYAKQASLPGFAEEQAQLAGGVQRVQKGNIRARILFADTIAGVFEFVEEVTFQSESEVIREQNTSSGGFAVRMPHGTALLDLVNVAEPRVEQAA